MHILNKGLRELLLHEIINPTQAKNLESVYRTEVLEFSPQEAVQITDAFKFSDYELGSVLGKYDGRVYETLFEEVKKDPINTELGLREDVFNLTRARGRHESKL